MPTRILVAEDFEPIRLLVCSVLEERPEFQVIAQVADGLDAVQKSQELQPDLILLDIVLPKLNGIAAAEQIRKVAPTSRILFMSQYTDSDIVQVAFDAGARGYVAKSDAGIELFEALEAVIQGGLFVSSRLAGSIH
jgi:two-component system, NarL family, response regulator NreC